VSDPNPLNLEELIEIAKSGEMEEEEQVDQKSVESADRELEGEKGQEATEEDLMALLSDTVADNETFEVSLDTQIEIAKNISKLKLRQLANKITVMAPPKLFPERKDDVYYFLTSMVGQSMKRTLKNAREKCRFIAKGLKELESYMYSEIELSLDEQQAIGHLFINFSADTVTESEALQRIEDNFETGWKQTLKFLEKDLLKLGRYAEETLKPIWVLITFYESLNTAFGLCRALDDINKYADGLVVDMTRDDKKNVVTLFVAIMELAPLYGLRNLECDDRHDVFRRLNNLNLNRIIDMLKKKK